jgi:GTPase SAR1 family protein
LRKKAEIEKTHLYVTIHNCRQLLREEPQLYRHFTNIFRRIDEIVEKPLKLAVLGEFSSGKSTFINRLIGKEILPTGITPVTSVVTILEYGEEEKIEVVYKNHEGETVKRVYDGYERLWKLQREWDEGDLYIPMEIRVFVNNPILKYFHIIDTPGFNDVSEMEKINWGLLRQVNYIIWLFNGTQPGKGSEMAVLKKLQEESLYRDNIFGVINFGDIIVHSPEEYEEKIVEINRHLGGGEIFVNYPLKIISSVKKDPFWTLKFEELKQDLSEYVLQKDKELAEQYLFQEGERLRLQMEEIIEKGEGVIDQLKEEYSYFWGEIVGSKTPQLIKGRIKRIIRRGVKELEEQVSNSIFIELGFKPLLEFGCYYLTNEKLNQMEEGIQTLYSYYLEEFKEKYRQFQAGFLERLRGYPVELELFQTAVPHQLREILSNLKLLQKSSRLLIVGYIIGLFSDNYLYKQLTEGERREVLEETLDSLLEMDLDLQVLFKEVGNILSQIEEEHLRIVSILNRAISILKELDAVYPLR